MSSCQYTEAYVRKRDEDCIEVHISILWLISDSFILFLLLLFFFFFHWRVLSYTAGNNYLSVSSDCLQFKFRALLTYLNRHIYNNQVDKAQRASYFLEEDNKRQTTFIFISNMPKAYKKKKKKNLARFAMTNEQQTPTVAFRID